MFIINTTVNLHVPLPDDENSNDNNFKNKSGTHTLFCIDVPHAAL